MRYLLILLLSAFLTVNAFEPPIMRTPGGIKPAAAKRLFPEPESISEDEQLFNYIFEQLPEADAQKLIDILTSPKTTLMREETYFEDLYWTSNDGHDLRRLAADVIELFNSKPKKYAKLKKDIQFIFYLNTYLSDNRYAESTPPLRAAIPFESLPATTRFVAERIKNVRDIDNSWCKELPLLERWLDTAREPTINDPFYEKGILLLIHGLPKSHPLLTKDDSCIKDLLFHAIVGNYERIFDALIKKGVNVNWKNGQDQTPLHKAAFSANESMVKKLLTAGAQVNVPTIFSQTALDFAKLSPYANKDTIIKMLTDKGAQSGEAL